MRTQKNAEYKKQNADKPRRLSQRIFFEKSSKSAQSASQFLSAKICVQLIESWFSAVILLILVSCLLLPVCLYAQRDTTWVRRYNEVISGRDGATAIVTDNMGNVCIAGWTGTGDSPDFITIKMNSMGETLWSRKYNGPGNGRDYAYAIAVDNSGNVYVAGESYGLRTDFDYATIKYNSTGIEQWVARYNGPVNGGDFAYALAVDNSGNVYVTGESDGSTTSYDYATIKYNSAGSEVWIQRYDGTGNDDDCAHSIWVDGAGNVYVTGESYDNDTDNDYATIKYNSAGIQQWVQRYNGPGDYDDNAYSIRGDLLGNVYVTGESYGEGTDFDYATIKYNSTGIELWVKRYDGPENDGDCANALAIDVLGNTYVTGESYALGTNYDYATIKYNTNGAQQWVQRYNGLGNGGDFASALAVDDLGIVCVTGESYGLGSGFDYATIKYNANGVQQWVQRYSGPGNGGDAACSIVIDGSGNVFIAGTSFGDGTYDDCATIKYNSAGTQHWVRRFYGQGNSYDEATFLAIDGTNNIYVTGGSEGSGTYYDYATVKYNSAGTQQWVQRYNGPGNGDDYPYSLAIDNFGNIYVTGESYGSGTNADYATIKYNSNGIQQWVQRYNGFGNGYDQAASISIDGSDNVYVTGISEGSNTNYDYVTIKYSSSGVQVWVQRYNGLANSIDYANAIALDSLGNVCVTGVSYGSGSSYDYLTIKYNSAGETLWTRRYNGPGNYMDGAFAIAADNAGNVYVTGRSYGSGTGKDWATIKYNAGGVEEWVQRYNGAGSGEDGAYCLALDGLGNVYVTGYSYNSSTKKDYMTIKYNSSGNVEWLQRYNGPENGDDEAYYIAVDNLGNVYVTGQSYGSGTNFDYVTIKYNSSGVQQWIERYDGSGNREDKAVCLAFDGMNNIYVTGKSFGANTSYDFATVKYLPSGAIEEGRTAFNLLQLFLSAEPNPFKTQTAICYSLTNETDVSLLVYDISGKLVRTLANEKKTMGVYSVNWDGTDEQGKKLSQGIYFYLLKTGEQTISKKILMLR